jgi:hypothetical protein
MEAWGVAARALDRVLATVIAARLLPLLLHAVSVALPLLPDAAERARLRAWVARHPATSFAVRRRVAEGSGAAPDAVAVTGDAAEALWHEACREAEAVRVALRMVEADDRAHHRPPARGPQLN